MCVVVTVANNQTHQLKRQLANWRRATLEQEQAKEDAYYALAIVSHTLRELAIKLPDPASSDLLTAELDNLFGASTGDTSE